MTSEADNRKAPFSDLYDGLWERLGGSLREAASNREAARRKVEEWLEQLERAASLAEDPPDLAELLLELVKTETEPKTRAQATSFLAAAFGDLGEALLAEGEIAEAATKLVLAMRLVPPDDALERAFLCRRLAHLRWEQSVEEKTALIDEAVALLRRADELAQDLADFELRAEILLDLGALYLEELAELDRARASYDTLLGFYREPGPPSWLALQGLVRAFLHDLRADLALEFLEGESRKFAWPRDSREDLVLRLWRGRALLELRRPARGLSEIFHRLVDLGDYGHAALAATAWLRSRLGAARGFEAAFAEIVLTMEKVPPLSGGPFEKLVRATGAGRLSVEWLQAHEEELDRTLLGRRLPLRGGG